MEKAKPDLAMLLLKAKKPEDQGSDESDGMPSDGDQPMDGKMAEESAAKDILMAVKTGDHMMLKEALKDLIRMCKDDEDGGEAEAEPDGDEADGGY